MPIKYFKRISVRLARITVVVALCLGLSVSFLQVYIDYQQQSNQLNQKVDELFSVSYNTAQRALYQLDPDLAQEVVQGLSNLIFVREVSIIDDRDAILATSTVNRAQKKFSRITLLLKEELSTYRLDITSTNNQYQGHLILTIDNNIALNSFYNRAVSIFVSGLLRNFVLSIVLLLFFHHILTRPFLSLANKFHLIEAKKAKQQLIAHEKNNQHNEIGYIVNSANRLIIEISDLNQGLEEKVEQRTKELSIQKKQLEKSNATLSITLEELKGFQLQLIEKEKMASLGRLVAGVAHEVNTPLGVSITSQSLTKENLSRLEKQFNDKTISENDLKEYLSTQEETNNLLEKNLNKVANLIQSFKQVAVSEKSQTIQTINIANYLKESTSIMKADLEKLGHKIIIEDSPLEIAIDVIPLNQIITNLIANSLMHGFENKEHGTIIIRFNQKDNHAVLVYADDGIGVSEEILQNMFDPFFTTKRNKGGVGLGMVIIFNRITQELNGSITTFKPQDGGLGFNITLPIKDSKNTN